MEKTEIETEALQRLKLKYKRLRRDYKAFIDRLLYKGIIDEHYASLHGYDDMDDESDDEE
jgi:hypothetical protein